ncbi:Integrase zinc binding domain [Popillia japonica]|uniref:RNA-directed DNA polymerase n=1 Tax=Popillia japonica TaxID=7064 RepID=A0AAW1JBU2_POPJA
MQHYALFLQSFNYNIKYKNTKLHANADALSRLPISSTSIHDYDVCDCFEISQIEKLPITVKELEAETVKDENLKQLLTALKLGLQAKHRFNIPQNEFTLQGNCIFRQQMAMIPKTLRRNVLEELHTARFGIVKMKALARGHCWWAGISYDIESICKNCTDCNQVKNNPEKVPVHPWKTPTAPFERVHVDFAGTAII